MVADIGQYAILRERLETDNKDLQEIIEHMSTGGLLATMERKKKFNLGVTYPGSLGLRQDLGGGSWAVREKGRKEGAHDGKKEDESRWVEALGRRWSWGQLGGGIRSPKLWK